jgi:hypothetical protein
LLSSSSNTFASFKIRQIEALGEPVVDLGDIARASFRRLPFAINRARLMSRGVRKDAALNELLA